MDPLSPNDPLWKLLGHARPVQPRGNFVQNVLREARQTPQDRGLWAALVGWWEETSITALSLKAGAVACALGLAVAWWPSASTDSGAIVTTEPAANVEPTLSDEDLALLADTDVLPTQRLDDYDALVSSVDTSTLTDRELAFLLY